MVAIRGISVYQAFERALRAPVAVDIVSDAVVPVGIAIVADPLAGDRHPGARAADRGVSA